MYAKLEILYNGLLPVQSNVPRFDQRTKPAYIECQNQTHMLNCSIALLIPCVRSHRFSVSHDLDDWTLDLYESDSLNQCIITFAYVLRGNTCVSYDECQFSVPNFYASA